MPNNHTADENARIARANSLRSQIEEIKKGPSTGAPSAPSRPRQFVNDKMRERYSEKENQCSEEGKEEAS